MKKYEKPIIEEENIEIEDIITVSGSQDIYNSNESDPEFM